MITESTKKMKDQFKIYLSCRGIDLFVTWRKNCYPLILTDERCARFPLPLFPHLFFFFLVFWDDNILLLIGLENHVHNVLFTQKRSKKEIKELREKCLCHFKDEPRCFSKFWYFQYNVFHFQQQFSSIVYGRSTIL